MPPAIEEVTDVPEGALPTAANDLPAAQAPTALVPVTPAATEPAKDVAPVRSADVCLALAIPQIKENGVIPEYMKGAGFRLSSNPKCDLEYSIDGEEMQVMTVSLKAYQEMSFASHTNLVQRVSSVALSKTDFGYRLKNMTGNGGQMVQFAPGYVAKIVALSLTEYPELIINPEVFLAGTDAGLRVTDELRPGFYPYKALGGSGVVFLKSVGPAMFHVLKDGESCLAQTSNVLAFQTFCKVEAKSIASHEAGGCCCCAAPKTVFPHMKITGPGLVMISPLYPDAKVFPISLEEYPELHIRQEVFMAASDSRIQIDAERIRRGKEKAGKGTMMFCLHGRGVAFLNATGVVQTRILAALETVVLTELSLVAFQGSCKVTQEKATAEDQKWLDVKVSGPGLIIIQSLPSIGRIPDRWGEFMRDPMKKIVPLKKEPVADQTAQNSTPSKPQAPSNLGDQKVGPDGIVLQKKQSQIDTE